VRALSSGTNLKGKGVWGGTKAWLQQSAKAKKSACAQYCPAVKGTNNKRLLVQSDKGKYNEGVHVA
jgi:hypothetical protein